MIIASRNSLSVEPWVPHTRTTHLEVAGTNVLRWENPNGFQASWAIQVGDTGEEQTEIVLLGASTPAGTAGTLTANTLYEHPADTPIFGIKYNQVVFERSTAGTAGTATPMTNGTVAMAPDAQNTIFDDTSGSTSYAYKTIFRNSVLAVNSTESDWIIPGGYSFYSLGRIRERAKEGLFSTKFIDSDLTWNDWANEWLYDMLNAAVGVNESYSLGTADVVFGTSGLGTISTSNFKQVKRVDVNYGAGFYMSQRLEINAYQPDHVFSSLYPYHVWRGDNVFEVKPAEGGGTAQLSFYTFGTSLVNDSDELTVPLRSYTKGCVAYLQSRAYQKDGKIQEAQMKLAESMAERQTFITEITPRDKTGPTRYMITEPVTGEDGLF